MFIIILTRYQTALKSKSKRVNLNTDNASSSNDNGRNTTPNNSKRPHHWPGKHSILLDFPKAFEKVPQRRLHLKCHHYGARSNTLAWIQDFLSRRTQQVTLEGVSSTAALVTSGVPQGMVLGPLLLLAYINDHSWMCHHDASLRTTPY